MVLRIITDLIIIVTATVNSIIFIKRAPRVFNFILKANCLILKYHVIVIQASLLLDQLILIRDLAHVLILSQNFKIGPPELSLDLIAAF